MITAVMPVKGREPLLKLTVSRLVKQGYQVVCAGHNEIEKEICTKAGAHFLHCPQNIYLGNKWQLCIDYARKFNPEAIMIMGSSDMVQDGWGEKMLPRLDSYAMAGTLGIYFLDIQKGNQKRMIWWAGYTNNRQGEPIGTGRLIGKKALDLIDWQLIDKNINSSIDYSILQNVMKVKDKMNIVYADKDLKALSISTYRWPNMHQFEKEAMNFGSIDVNPDQIINKYFPEMINLFNE